MQEAYLEYEPVTGAITGVHWSKPLENWIEISHELAMAFMEGSKKMHLHRVVMDKTGSLVIDSFRDRPPLPVFRELLPEDVSSNIKIKINKSSVTVKMSHATQHNIGVFVTLKNDPTWLVQSFNITAMSKETGKKSMNIKIPGAEDYSYHIGAIDEIQAI